LLSSGHETERVVALEKKLLVPVRLVQFLFLYCSLSSCCCTACLVHHVNNCTLDRFIFDGIMVHILNLDFLVAADIPAIRQVDWTRSQCTTVRFLTHVQGDKFCLCPFHRSGGSACSFIGVVGRARSKHAQPNLGLFKLAVLRLRE
jgi:hypothetical protein